MRYRVLIEQDEDGVHVAEVPALPGCISQGQTRSEAVDNIKEAIAAYLPPECTFLCQTEAVSDAFDQKFHVEQISDRWTSAGLRRGQLFLVARA